MSRPENVKEREKKTIYMRGSKAIQVFMLQVHGYSVGNHSSLECLSQTHTFFLTREKS